MTADIVIQNNAIDFAPETQLQEILQNVRYICSTIKGSVPLDRELGVSSGLVDLPVSTVRAMVSAEYIDAVRRFEPRAEVVSVKFRDKGDGQVLPVISIRVKD